MVTHKNARKFSKVRKWKKKDPLIFSRGYLNKNKLLNKKQIETLDKKINSNVDKDFKFLSKLTLHIRAAATCNSQQSYTLHLITCMRAALNSL